MIRRVRSIRILLIVLVLLGAMGLAIYLAKHEDATTIGFRAAEDGESHPFVTMITLTFKDFRPAGDVLAGDVAIEVSPQNGMKAEDRARAAKDFKTVLLRFHHHQSNSLTYLGGSDSPIDLSFPPAWGSLQGKGTFTWAADAKSGPFFYPFDRYVLDVNPLLLQVTGGDSYPIDPIDTMATDFGNSNFVPHLKSLGAHSPNDLYEIELKRPVVFRLLAVIVGVLLGAWLLYLVVFAKPEEYVGHLVTLFVGVFSIRTSLLSGAPVFPGLIDYCALGVYFSAVLVILIKWMMPDRNTTTCRFCQSSIPIRASYCPQCTRFLAEDKPLTATH